MKKDTLIEEILEEFLDEKYVHYLDFGHTFNIKDFLRLSAEKICNAMIVQEREQIKAKPKGKSAYAFSGRIEGWNSAREAQLKLKKKILG